MNAVEQRIRQLPWGLWALSLGTGNLDDIKNTVIAALGMPRAVECAVRCQYAEDVSMHGHSCDPRCMYLTTERNWLVWSYEHDAWWGPKSNGYRSSILRAGMYTEAEAKQIATSANAFPNPRHTSGMYEEALSLEDAIARDFMDWSREGSLLEYLLGRSA